MKSSAAKTSDDDSSAAAPDEPTSALGSDAHEDSDSSSESMQEENVTHCEEDVDDERSEIPTSEFELPKRVFCLQKQETSDRWDMEDLKRYVKYMELTFPAGRMTAFLLKLTRNELENFEMRWRWGEIHLCFVSDEFNGRKSRKKYAFLVLKFLKTPEVKQRVGRKKPHYDDFTGTF